MNRPDGLRDAGGRLWDAVVSRYDLSLIELEMLESAARHRDVIARLDDILDDSLETIGAAGQPKLNPAVGELRQARIALSKLLVDLALPPDVDGDVTTAPPPVSFNSRRASEAAKVRHDRARRKAAHSGKPAS